ncbi:MAG: tetratricopeptide repeat protein, partial [Gammaproteobacteria bacterium]
VAQYNLGISYRDGNGVPRDGKSAVNWLSRSAKNGYALAQNDLGALFYEGLYVKKSRAKLDSGIQKLLSRDSQWQCEI